jgi:hypothetical protein
MGDRRNDFAERQHGPRLWWTATSTHGPPPAPRWLHMIPHMKTMSSFDHHSA